VNVIEAPLPLIVAVDGAAPAKNGGEGRVGPGPSVCPITPEKSHCVVNMTKGDLANLSATV
jgi:hypothetical protein